MNMCDLLFETEDSDVVLLVETEDGHEIVVASHRFVLRRKSTVFKTMLNSEYFEEGKTGIVKIKVPGSISVATTFVKFLYTEQLECNATLAMSVALLKVAHVYDLPSLVSQCQKKIEKELDPFNICDTYSELEMILSDTFASVFLQRITGWAYLIFHRNIHVCLSEKTMVALLKSAQLNLFNEGQAMKDVWNWGKWSCTIRHSRITTKHIKGVVHNLLPEIRWFLIDKKDVSSENLFMLQEKRPNKNLKTVRRPGKVLSLIKFV